MRQIGCTDKAEMHIELSTDKHVYFRPYRLSYHEREQLKDTISELKDADIIEDSASPFASPVLLVRKSSGEIRMCIDYRTLNKNTVRDKHPLPRIDDQLDQLQGNMYYTSLDLFSGYFQVPMSRTSREKTAFTTPDGHYQFKRMPFASGRFPKIDLYSFS